MMNNSRAYLIAFLSSLQACGMNPKMEQVMTILSMHELCKKKETNVSMFEIMEAQEKILEVGKSNLQMTVKQYLSLLMRESIEEGSKER